MDISLLVCNINIKKNIALHADCDEFQVSYSLDTSECSMYSMSAGQMQNIADTISDFLQKFGEHEDTKVFRYMTDNPKKNYRKSHWK